MAYEAKTQNDLTKWWVIGTGSTVNRLSEIMDDCPLGPAIYYTTGWTAAGAEYYRTQATANDSAQEKIGAGAWTALALGAGIGLLIAGQYFYDVATTRIYVRLTGDAVPNATNQVRAHYLWDGSGAGPAIMTEVVEDQYYQIHLSFDIGDGTSAITLTSIDGEVVYFDDTTKLTSQAACVVTIGEIVNGAGSRGSIWSIAFNGDYNDPLALGTISVYGTTIILRNYNVNAGLGFVGTFTDCTFIFVVSGGSGGVLSVGGTFTRCKSLHKTSGAITGRAGISLSAYTTNAEVISYYGDSDITIPNLVLTHATPQMVMGYTAGITLSLLDANKEPTTILNLSNCTSQMQYTIAIHIADKDGADLSGATVTWLDSQSNTGNSNTDISGNVSFTLTSKKWVGTSETLTNFNTFTFTISKAGYQTLVLENITLSEAIDWHLELQQTRNINLSKYMRIYT